jgi:PAS domain S-box-containing protein
MSNRFPWKRHFMMAVAVFALMWVGDALMDAVVFNYGGGSWLDSLASQEPREIWMRTFSSSLLVLFFLVVEILGERRRRAETALRESGELSSLFLDSTSDAICIVDTRGFRITAANGVFLSKYSLSAPEAHSRRLAELVAAGKIPDVMMAQITDCAASAATMTREICSSSGDGRKHYDEVITQPIGDLERGVDRVLQVIRDITVRRTAEALLRESEARYRAIFENTGTAMAIILPDGTLHMVNKVFEALTGYSRQELEGGMRWTDFLGQGDRERITGGAKEGGALPLQRSFELQAVNRYGESRSMAGNWAPIAGTGQAVLSLVDISAQKQVEQALRESQAGLAVAQRIARLGNWVWDVTTDSLTWSEEMYNIYEVDPARFAPTYDDFLQMLHPEDRDRVIRAINDALYNRKPYHLDFRVVLDGGVIRTMSVGGEVTYDEQGNPLRMVGTNQDVTWRNEAEEALRSSEAKFSKAFRASPDSIVISRVDDGMYIDVNEAFEQITGYSRDEVIGRTSLELQLWAEPDARMVMLRLLNQYGHVRNLEVKFRMKTGEVREVLWSAEVIEYCGEACLIAISRDVTDQRHLERELLESDARLYMKHEELKNLFHQMEAIRREWEEIMDCISDMFILADQWGKIRRFNRAVETFTGKAHRDIVGRDWLPFLENHGFKAHLDSPGEEIVHEETGKRFVLKRYAFPTQDVDGSAREVIIINDTTGISLRRSTASLRLAAPRRDAH